MLRAPSNAERAVTLVATGSEVSFAVNAREALDAEGVATAVVSMPCCEVFAAQSQTYREEVLATSSVLGATEAGMRQSWDRLIGGSGRFVGMDSFGASAPGGALYKQFGITVEAIVAAAKSALRGN